MRVRKIFPLRRRVSCAGSFGQRVKGFGQVDFSAWIARAMPEAKAAQAVRAQAPAPPSTRERPVISVAQAVRNAIAGVRDV